MNKDINTEFENYLKNPISFSKEQKDILEVYKNTVLLNDKLNLSLILKLTDKFEKIYNLL